MVETTRNGAADAPTAPCRIRTTMLGRTTLMGRTPRLCYARHWWNARRFRPSCRRRHHYGYQSSGRRPAGALGRLFFAACRAVFSTAVTRENRKSHRCSTDTNDKPHDYRCVATRTLSEVEYMPTVNPSGAPDAPPPAFFEGGYYGSIAHTPRSRRLVHTGEPGQ